MNAKTRGHRAACPGPRLAGGGVLRLALALTASLALAAAAGRAAWLSPAGVPQASPAAWTRPASSAPAPSPLAVAPAPPLPGPRQAVRLTLPVRASAAGAADGKGGTPTPWGMAGRGVVALLTLPILFRAWRRPRVVNRIQGPGLEVISPSERRDFIPLEERFQALDFLTKISTVGSLRLSANLNKVTLSIRKYGYLMEDKNFRNALLVNRRRVRRTLLRDGDVLDLGDLTLLYRDTRLAQVIRHSSVTPSDRKAQIKFQRLRGPIRKGTPMLVMEGLPNRIFYLTKNKVFIGRSETNDLVIKSRAVYYRHAKIERVGGRYKIQDLSILGNTFVNNRRVEQRFLKEGDEISIESYRFRFQVASKAMRERPPTQEAAAEETEDVAPESASLVESGDGGDDAEENPTL